MIDLAQYVGVHSNSPDWTTERQVNAGDLLSKVNALLDELIASHGYSVAINPRTDSQVSGETFGGFRPQSCPIGAANSAHKQGQAVDIFDPHETLDTILTKFPDYLVKYNLYRESPGSTLSWCHLQTRKTLSGKRTFLP